MTRRTDPHFVVLAAALFGVLLGLGLALGANVGGTVLAFYGLTFAAGVAWLVVALRSRR